MPGEEFIELQMMLAEERRRYLEDVKRYLQAIKRVARRFDPDARVILFGSYVEGRARPDSDVDVLVVTRLASDTWERARIRAAVAEEVGVSTPFEIHIVTPEEYEGWYRRFIGRSLEI